MIVDPAEYERGCAKLKLRQTIVDLLFDDVTLESRLAGSTSSNLDHAPEFRGSRSRSFKARIGVIDVSLLSCQLGVLTQRASIPYFGGTTRLSA